MKAKRLIAILIALVVCSLAQARKKPLIGVVPGCSGEMNLVLSRSYTDAVARAGGIPVILPQVDDPLTAAEYISRLDGILFTGGVDVDPSRYGETVLNESVEIDLRRDSIEFLYAEAALLRRLPIMAICRGEQLMNVVLGGSLYQDLPSQKPGDIPHRQKTDSRYPTHSISVAPGSILHRAMGETELMVNTSHHQAVKRPSDKVVVTAYSPDGVVEAYESGIKGQWILAVQFHPEQLVRADDKWLALFRTFVKECR